MIKRILPMLLILIFVLYGCGKSEADMHDNTYEKISMSEGIERIESDEGYILLDVRRTDEFEAGHIPGAVNLPNEEIGTEEIPSLPNKSQMIYIYCRSGNRSKQAADKLLALGYTNIIEFGGIIDYTGELEYEN
ncbi:rhodanese-like domain-containing protein [Ruminococcus sp.]|uniref:rhodanese-like domain-containing protein n=1 Tax=Ruminococcus sp. TaxID=41978 RepID=UPI003F0772B7